MIERLLEQLQSAKANLPAEKIAPKKGAWLPSTEQNPGWTEGIESQATQGSLQVDSLAIVHPPVHIINEEGAAPYPEQTIRRRLPSGQILGE